MPVNATAKSLIGTAAISSHGERRNGSMRLSNAQSIPRLSEKQHKAELKKAHTTNLPNV